MKTLFASVLLGIAWCVIGAGSLHADETLRRIQQSLHDLGFYFGAIDGSPGDETTQAIRRYQIRNGLSVTGQLNDETRQSIDGNGTTSTAGNGGSAASASSRPRVTPVPSANRRSETATPTPAPAPAYRPPSPPSSRSNSPGSAYDDEGAVPAPRAPRGDRPDLRVDDGERPEARPYPPGPGTVPRGGFAPSEALTDIFASTPYEFAPPPVQADVLRKAQVALRREGYYDGQVNGVPGPVTAGALSNFQRINRLPRTGRLDVSTLGILRLLPGRQTVDPRGNGRGGPNIIFQGRAGE